MTSHRSTSYSLSSVLLARVAPDGSSRHELARAPAGNPQAPRPWRGRHRRAHSRRPVTEARRVSPCVPCPTRCVPLRDFREGLGLAWRRTLSYCSPTSHRATPPPHLAPHPLST